MHIANSNGDFDLQLKQEIETMIRESAFNTCDDIWISGVDEFPALTLLVNGNYACVHYFINDTGDVWQSVGDCNQDIIFKTGDGNPEFAPIGATISLEKAIECMRLFFDNLQKPDCIQWREL